MSTIQEFMPAASAPAPVVAPTGRDDTCRICPRPFADWDTTDPLFNSAAVDCPACIRDAIAEDHAHVRRADL